MQSRSAFLTPLTRLGAVVLGLAIISFPLTPAAEAGIVKAFQPKWEGALSPGVDYAVGRMKTSGGRRQSVRVATITPTHPAVQMRSLISNNKVVGRERASMTTKRFSRPGRRATLATNGTMAKRDAVNAYAAPIGMHISNGEVMVAQACTRPSIGISRDGTARISDVRVHVELTLPGRSVKRQVHRINTNRDNSLVVLYTKRFAASTRTRSGGLEVILDLENKVGPKDSQVVKVVNIRRGGGNTKLRAGQAVLSSKATSNKWMRDLRVGDKMRLNTRVVRYVNADCGGKIVEASGWGDTMEAMSGNYATARNGKIAAPSRGVYLSGSQRHPRTGVGITANGQVLMVTVDGRQGDYSVGVTLAEMGRLMLSLGAKSAFNLDGGGSTVMARRYPATNRFKVTNRPSDGRERDATQALSVFEVRPN